jgi:hypothetical protein
MNMDHALLKTVPPRRHDIISIDEPKAMVAHVAPSISSLSFLRSFLSSFSSSFSSFFRTIPLHSTRTKGDEDRTRDDGNVIPGK